VVVVVVVALIRCSDMLGFSWLCCGCYAWQHFILAIVGVGSRLPASLSVRYTCKLTEFAAYGEQLHFVCMPSVAI